MKNIAVRLEGGLGDCLLAHRFIPAIKEKHPGCEITAFIDSEGQTFQRDALQLFYPNEYKELRIIKSKEYKKIIVDTQFGPDPNFYGAIENVPNHIRLLMETTFDKFYDLHIDGLKFTKYDFRWLKYFYIFPTPQIGELPTKDYVRFVLHLASNNLANEHRMEDWYIQGLVKRLAAKAECQVIVTDSTREYLRILEGIENVVFIEGELLGISRRIANADCFICIDSGLKYIAYAFGVPVICFTKQAYEPHRVAPSHKIRWLIYENDCVPMHYDSAKVATIAGAILKNKGVAIIPQVADSFDNYAINRIYTVNKELSIANEN